MKTIKVYSEYLLRTLAFLLGLMFLLIGIGTLTWQIIHYLQAAVWQPVPLMSWMPEQVRIWVQYPTSWTGLAGILRHVFEFVPASLAMVLIGMPFFGRRKGLDTLRAKYSTETKIEDIEI